MSCLISSMSVGHDSNDSMSTKRKRSVLSIKDKQIIISRLDKGEKGTNLALQFAFSKQPISNIRKNKDKVLKFTDNIETNEGLKRNSLGLQMTRGWIRPRHLVYSAEVDWNSNFRPTSSRESETFLFAATCKLRVT